MVCGLCAPERAPGRSQLFARRSTLGYLPAGPCIWQPLAGQPHAMRDTCYICYRPRFLCLCDRLPRIDNRTELVVLQHPRERAHPFGSARMLVQSLRRARLVVATRGPGKSVTHPMSLAADAVLLYPRPDSDDIGSLRRDVGTAPRPLPSQVLVLDGTWSQAHRLYRDNPYLQALPHYRFSPQRPSRYLVRREPKAHCVSTLEAAVEVLSLLEPDLAGLDDLLRVFERMNGEQVTVRKGIAGRPRHKKARARPRRVIPAAMQRDPSNLVVVYGESGELGLRADTRRKELLQWCAVRLGAVQQEFSAFVLPTRGLPSAAHLARLGLCAQDLVGAGCEENVLAEFSAFLRPDDTLLAWNNGTFKLLPAGMTAMFPCVQLKAVYCNSRGGRCGMLEDVMAREDLSALPLSEVPGRARTRLGNAAAVAASVLVAGETRSRDGGEPAAVDGGAGGCA